MRSYTDYRDHLSRIADLGYASAVLSWDQECYMPPKGADQRSRQLSTLAGIGHELFTRPDFGELLEKLSKDSSLAPKEQRNIEQSLRDYRQRKKYSREFVEVMSRTISEAFQAWQEAKEKNSFSIFAPKLGRLIELKQEECEILGYEEHPYDALIDQYEPKTTAAEITELFSGVRKELLEFVKLITERPSPGDSFMYGKFSKEKQWEFGLELLKQMGYDLEAGRQDLSSHPFTIHFGSQDVRVTTRVSADNLYEMIWSCIHEGGHALYEQGLPVSEYGAPCGEAISLGIHESQSRLWENNIGRGMNYWKFNFPQLQQLFPEQLSSVSVESFYAAINRVKPSLIRTSADELTYHFHVMIRFELEKALISREVRVKDLPAAWNEKYREYLGVEVPDDAQGVLQDIHWSHGSFGYFPTYSLGSFYAAQFYHFATKELKDLDNDLQTGNLKPMLNWLRDKIHQHGKFYSASGLCESISGEKLNFKYFMNYARKKYGVLYKLESVIP